MCKFLEEPVKEMVLQYTRTPLLRWLIQRMAMVDQKM